jgi:hypothetical protein
MNVCFKYSFSAILNHAFSFIRFLGSDGRLMEILIPAYVHGVSSWFMEIVLVLTLCTSALVRKCSSLLVMKFINENIYSYGRVKISRRIMGFDTHYES